jgi:superfamily I DNA/RNA helicase
MDKVIFAGDTAQTIAKGVNNRIADLNSLMQNASFKTATIPLTINYRSQNNILQLANNLVRIIEELFPKSIDKMAQEVAERVGPKPYLIEAVSEDLLCKFLFGCGSIEQEKMLDDDFEVLDDDTKE